eukprot:scaffold177_cov334-Pavlova_lutheri.AAC.101
MTNPGPDVTFQWGAPRHKPDPEVTFHAKSMKRKDLSRHISPCSAWYGPEFLQWQCSSTPPRLMEINIQVRQKCTWYSIWRIPEFVRRNHTKMYWMCRKTHLGNNKTRSTVPS